MAETAPRFSATRATSCRPFLLVSSDARCRQVYCLTAGKQYLPGQIASDRQRRNLQKTDEEYRRRIELLQDFEFPEASQRVILSDDGNFALATGARRRLPR